ncbi:hypothetical protein NDU88_001725 [Pleurodeles waltl]|uniref:Secreted protein n=1 Tax=Pleurodeles waltl TaxID=8319 RepID=A0AAV7WJ68_PLEWA|nr:hypothetical protein NDU88_001725 [Pleurodeles waltl]
MDAGRHGSRSPCGLFSLLLAAAGTPSPVSRRRDSAPFVRPYRPGASREFPALRPAPTRSPDMIPCRRCCKGIIDGYGFTTLTTYFAVYFAECCFYHR